MGKAVRTSTLIQRVLADEIQNHLKDKVGFITITEVKLTNEFSFMYAYYTVFGDEKAVEKTKQALDRANGFLKNQVAKRVKMRKVPELVFVYDESFEKGMRVERLIQSIKQ